MSRVPPLLRSPTTREDGLGGGRHLGSGAGTPAFFGAGALTGPSTEGLAGGLWAVPAWVVAGLGSAIVVGVIAYLAGRRIQRRRPP